MDVVRASPGVRNSSMEKGKTENEYVIGGLGVNKFSVFFLKYY